MTAASAGTTRAGFTRAQLFIVGVAVATIVPWVSVLAAYTVGVDMTEVWIVATVFGVAHVGTTSTFYADPEMRPILWQNRRRYLIAPAAAVTAGVAFFAVAPDRLAEVALLGFTLWQTHHFTRQNLGCFAFTCKAMGDDGPTAAERRVINLTGWAGLAGVAITASGYTPWPTLDVLGALGAILLGAAAIQAVLTHPKGWRAVALAVAVLFYAPLFFLRGNLTVAIAAYGFAHGAQYYMMTGQLRHGRTPAGRARSLVATIAGFVLIGLPLAVWNPLKMATPPWWLLGVYIGLVASHFIVDAGAWKAKDPAQRAYMGRRFDFL